MISEPMSLASAFLSQVDVDNKMVVDVGCGAGALVRQLRQHGARPIGVECGAIMRAQAVAADPDHADDYLDAGGEALPLADDSADVVVYSLSLHHVPSELRVDAIQEAHRVLKAGGVLCVMEPRPEGPGHLVFAPIADETVICGEVQSLLAELSDHGFTHTAALTFTTEWVYPDADAALADAVGIDPERQAALAERSGQVRELFDCHGVTTSQGVALAQPVKLDRFVAS